MAYDSVRHRVVLFGGKSNVVSGGTFFGDTWEWDGTAWSLRSATGPSARLAGAGEFDAARGKFVIHGGASANGHLADTWEWDGNSWTLIAASSAIGPQIDQRMTYDTVRQRIVQFGGSDTVNSGKTWDLSVPLAVSISTQPTPSSSCPTGTATFSITVGGSSPFTYAWRKGGLSINTATNPSAATATFSLTNVQPADAGSYDCIVTNACGSVTSNAASLTICATDFDCDGTVDFFDYDSFVTAFEAGDLRSDFDGDGTIDFFDYDAFVNAFELGC